MLICRRSKHASKDPFSPEQHNIIRLTNDFGDNAVLLTKLKRVDDFRAAIKRGAKLIKDHGGGDLPVEKYEFYSDLL